MNWVAPVIWFIIGLVIFLLEFSMPGFILFFFGIGAWLVAIVTLVAGDLNLTVQLLLFILSSLTLLVLLRSKFRQLFSGGKNPVANFEGDFNEIIGKKVPVIETIQPNRKGKVELYGTNWLAQAEEEISAGDMVEITGKDNLTLIVKKLN